MTPEQLAESELRMTRFLTKKWPWQSWKVRKAFVAAGVPKEELAVVVAYKRSEERDGMSRTTRAKGIKRPSGPVSGYKTLPEPIVEKSLDVVPEVLWGTDVTAAVQEELGFDAAPRRQSGPGRRKLAPVRLTQEFTLGKRTLVGAGDGSSGHAVPELLPDGTLSYAVEPTVGECHEAELRKAPVRKAAESEWYHAIEQVRRLPPLRKVRRCDSISLAGCRRAPERPVASLPRSEHEHRAGRFITRWRPEGSEEWLPPEGMLPKPVSQEAWIGGIELDDYVRFLP